MVRTQVQLTEGQMKSLKRLSTASGKSIAEIIRNSVDLLVSRTAMPNAEERVSRALAVAGKFSSGRNDISTDHDRYLAEAYET